MIFYFGQFFIKSNKKIIESIQLQIKINIKIQLKNFKTYEPN